MRFFVENRAWYDRRGIPYQLGMLYSNMSGCGKSSAIRAIANYTKRHIINVNFGRILTLQQLNHLFFNEELEVEDSQGNITALTIPIDRRLYVVEELDAAGGLVYQRDSEGPVFGRKTNVIEGELTLADILLVLDGNRESPGRVVIMTANHPELLDEALVRPGRMDVSVAFTHASQRLMKEMYTGFFEQQPPEDLGLDKVDNSSWLDNSSGLDKTSGLDQTSSPALVHLTPAEVSQVYFRHLPEPADAQAVVTDLITTSHTKRAAAERAAAAAQARRLEEERRRIENHERQQRKVLIESFDPEDQDTIGMKPLAEAHTVHGTNVQDMFRSLLES